METHLDKWLVHSDQSERVVRLNNDI